jgi:hypothetical protein
MAGTPSGSIQASGRRWRPDLVAGLVAAAVVVVPPSGRPRLHTGREVGPPPPRCEPVSAHEVVPAAASIDTGEYALTLVATRGVSAGASVSGRLWLVSTASARDSEISAGARAPLGDTIQVPLYGASNVDFTGVSALVASEEKGDIPGAQSFTPLRPGVLVSHLANPGASQPAWALLVGTIANNRVACDSAHDCSSTRPTSGPGATLEVYRIASKAFAGAWRTINPDGARGYFCAVPPQFFQTFQTLQPHHPPVIPP